MALKEWGSPLGAWDDWKWLWGPFALLLLIAALPVLAPLAAFMDTFFPDWLRNRYARKDMMKVAHGYSRSWSSQWL